MYLSAAAIQPTHCLLFRKHSRSVTLEREFDALNAIKTLSTRISLFVADYCWPSMASLSRILSASAHHAVLSTGLTSDAVEELDVWLLLQGIRSIVSDSPSQSAL